MQIIETSDDKVLKLKSFIEEMELQLSLEKADIIDELEKHKKNLNTYINEQKEAIYIDDKKDELKGFFEELQLQLSLGRAENKELFEENREKVIQKTNSIDNLLKIYEKKPEQNQEYLIEVFGYKVYKLRTAMEMARLEYALGKADLIDEIQGKKQELLKNLNHFKSVLENDVKIVETNFEKLQSEIKSVFHGFFSGIKHNYSKIDTHVNINSQDALEKQRHSVVVAPDPNHQGVIKTDK